MNNPGLSWLSGEIDTINITGPGGSITLAQSAGDQISLEQPDSSRSDLPVSAVLQESDLSITFSEPLSRHQHLILRLPAVRIWNLNISLGFGDFFASDLDFRLRFSAGKADVHMVHCRGAAVINSGDGTIVVDDFTALNTPLPQTGGPKPFPVSDPDTPIPPFPPLDNPQGQWDGEAWKNWGRQFGAQAAQWGQSIGRSFSGNFIKWAEADLIVSAGRGDVQLRRINAAYCSFNFSKGNLQLIDGNIQNLAIAISHGDVLCSGVLPVSEWTIKTHHGNLQLALPAQTQARIDAVSRSGDIHSDIPLIRAPRPGRESDRTVRMVGTAGGSIDNPAQLNLSVSHGNITIEVLPPIPGTSVQPESATVPVHAANEPLVTPPPADTQIFVQAAPSPIQDQTAIDTPASPQTSDPFLEILKALRHGKISVEEADMLLNHLQKAG